MRLQLRVVLTRAGEAAWEDVAALCFEAIAELLPAASSSRAAAAAAPRAEETARRMWRENRQLRATAFRFMWVGWGPRQFKDHPDPWVRVMH